MWLRIAGLSCRRFGPGLDEWATAHSAEAVIARIFVSAIRAAQVFLKNRPDLRKRHANTAAASIILDYDNAKKRCAASGLEDAQLYTFVANVLFSMTLQGKTRN